MIKKGNRNFYVLIFIIFLLNTVLSITFNLTNYRDKLKNKNVILLELKKEVSKEEVTLLENRLLSIKGISKVKFYSNDDALENINKDLKITAIKDGNPIPDTLICYLDSESVALKDITPQFNEIKEIQSLYYDEKIFEKNRKFYHDIKLLVLVSWVFFIAPLTLTFFSLYRGMIHNSSVYYYFHSKNAEKSVIKGWRVSFLPMTVSIVVGAGAAIGVYILIYKGIMKGKLISVEEILKIFTKVDLALFFISAFLSKKLLKQKQ